MTGVVFYAPNGIDISLSSSSSSFVSTMKLSMRHSRREFILQMRIRKLYVQDDFRLIVKEVK